jgi:hypothetical protein
VDLNILKLIFGERQKTPTTADIIRAIQQANEAPSDENLEDQITEIKDLALAAADIVRRQDSYHLGVVELPTVLSRAEAAKQTQWFVVGDLHGDYQSLCRILLKIYLRPGIEAETTKIVFLGDYIDRGDRPMQVLRLLLTLKTGWPEHFWLLQGNHEALEKAADGTVTSRVTPCDTLEFWQPHFGTELFRALAEFFSLLPVALRQTVQRGSNPFGSEETRILYVHGGIPRTEHLKLPLSSPECRKGFTWSDPELEKDEVLNGPARRFSFGRNDFIAFMTHHGLELLIRGHEVRKDGFDFHEEMKGADQRIVTLFSCGGKFVDPERSDSHYKTDVVVPRFIHLQPDSHQDLPLSVEEVYRDDICLAGNLQSRDQDFFESLVSCLRLGLRLPDGASLHVHQDPVATDRSIPYDQPDSFVTVKLNVDADGLVTGEVFCHKRYADPVVFQLATADAAEESARIVTAVQSVYPIFGRMPADYFASLKEEHHA